MTIKRLTLIATLVAVLGLAMSGLSLAAAPLQARPTIQGLHGMVSSGHYLASWIGNKILMDGGNAFDAGVGMVLAQSWLEEYNFGFAGECPILIYSAKDKKVFSIDGDMAAPKSIDAAWFKDNGIVQVPGDGFVAAGVPAAPDALITLLDKWGTMSFAQVAKEPIRLAEEGFPIFDGFVSAVSGIKSKMEGEWPSSKALLMPGGKLPVNGQVMKNPDLANTWKKLCDTEAAALKAGKSRHDALMAVRDRFYKGDIAQTIVKFQKENAVTDANGMKLPGNLTLDDLASYTAKVREPWTINYHGYDVYKCGPWTQGPSFLIHLKLLEQFDLKKLGYNTADYWHVMAETMKLAQADKVEWLGDEEYIEVPKTGLLSTAYAAERAKLVDMKKANTENVPGDPWKYDGRQKPATYPYVPGKYTPRVTFQAADASPVTGESFNWDTTGTRAVDAAGNMFSATPSGGWFTSSPIIPGLGFPLGTRLQMFFVDRTDHARSYVPGARVSTTLSPTLVMKDGKPFMALGMPGGDEQDQNTLQDFLHVADFGADFQEALELPHLATTNMPSLFYPHGRTPGAISLPAIVPAAVIDDLKARGHKVSWRGTFSTNATMVGVDPITGVLIGASGPADNSDTRPRYAIGW